MSPAIEAILIWMSSLGLIGLIMFVYHRQVRAKERTNLLIQRESLELGLNKPPVQHPIIDPYRCIGCGSCVAACPEGDVLGMVSGKAMILNGLRCVGHGKCEASCPVGAVTIGLGDQGARSDLPLLDQRLETTREGIFVAGELGGLGLIKHAVNQGRMAAQACQKSLLPIQEHQKVATSAEIWDLIVVGAGPAGLSAGITAIENDMSVLVLEQSIAGGSILQYPRKNLALIQPVEIPAYGWLKKTHYDKDALLEIWEKAVENVALNIRENERVMAISGDKGCFEIQTTQHTFFARRMILALGRRGTPRKLGAPGEDLPKVAYQLMDAVNFSGDHVLVVGGGNSAVEAALALSRQPGNTVTLSYRRNRFFRIRKLNRDRLDTAIKKGAINVIFNSNVSEIHAQHVTLHTDTGDVTLPNDYVFILIGGIPPFGLLEKTGIRMGQEKGPSS